MVLQGRPGYEGVERFLQSGKDTSCIQHLRRMARKMPREGVGATQDPCFCGVESSPWG